MDLKQCPAKPNYDMASELPLVLYDCHFENVEWQYQNEIDMSGEITPLRLYRAMEDQWSCYMTKSLMYSRMLQQLDQATVRNVSENGGPIKLAGYAASESSKDTTISLGGDLRMFMGKKYAKVGQWINERKGEGKTTTMFVLMPSLILVAHGSQNMLTKRYQGQKA
jgi:tRNA pseudouridine38/39 synthase